VLQAKEMADISNKFTFFTIYDASFLFNTDRTPILFIEVDMRGGRLYISYSFHYGKTKANKHITKYQSQLNGKGRVTSRVSSEHTASQYCSTSQVL
jgi:hypothetical protein